MKLETEPPLSQNHEPPHPLKRTHKHNKKSDASQTKNEPAYAKQQQTYKKQHKDHQKSDESSASNDGAGSKPPNIKEHNPKPTNFSFSSTSYNPAPKQKPDLSFNDQIKTNNIILVPH